MREDNNIRKRLEKSGAKLPERVVQRKLKREILPWMGREEIIVLTGARQTGKSVLIYQLIYDYLIPKTKNIYYFNLDIPHHLDFISDIDHLINLITGSRGKVYLFIDEIQRLKEPGLFLKGLYDLHLPLKIVVSGSSSLEIKSKIHEALTGRKILFHLNPFDFEELSWVLFPGRNFTDVAKNTTDFQKVLYHYLTYGSYPAVAMEKNERKKLRLLEEIFQSYLDKDIKAFLNVENENAFRNLIRLLSSQIGSLINKDELSNTLGIHKNTLDNYLFFLEQTFVLDFVRPFYRNPRKELLKNPKVYFRDLGMRNYTIGSFGDFEFRPDKGSLFENFSYLCLREKLSPSVPIHFWRTKAGAEVDFVILQGLKPIPFEIKSTKLKQFNITKSLRSFLKIYQCQKAYCVNLSLSGSRRLGKTEVTFLTPAVLTKTKLQRQ